MCMMDWPGGPLNCCYWSLPDVCKVISPQISHIFFSSYFHYFPLFFNINESLADYYLVNMTISRARTRRSAIICLLLRL